MKSGLKKFRKILVPLALFFGLFFLYIKNPNDRIDDTVFFYFPAIWAFPRHFIYKTAFATPYHILYGFSVWLANRIFNLATGQSALFIETAYWQSAFFASVGVAIFYLLLRELKRTVLVAFLASLFLGFSYVFWSFARMFSSGAIIFFGTILGFYSLVYFINRNFSRKSLLISGFLFFLAYLASQTAILTIPPLLFYANKKVASKKRILFGFFKFAAVLGILLIPTLLFLYKFEWRYENYHNLFSRMLGKRPSLGLRFEFFQKIFKHFSETVYNGTIAIFGVHRWLRVNTAILYLILLLIVIRKRFDGFIQALICFYFILLISAPLLLRDVFRYLKFWLLFLIPIIYILFAKLDDIWVKIRKNKKQRSVFIICVSFLFLAIFRADLTNQPYPETWGYRQSERGVVSERDRLFYKFIREDTSENSLILHDTAFYYANVVTFTQRYSRRLDYALANNLLAEGDEIAPYDPQRPIFLISAFNVSDIYIIKDSIIKNFHFQFEKKSPGLFDGYKLNLYRFTGREERGAFLDNEISSIYRRALEKQKFQEIDTKKNFWLPLFAGEDKGKKFIIVAPKLLPESIKPIPYPERCLN